MRCSARRSRARSTPEPPPARKTHDSHRFGGRHRLGPHVHRAGDGDDGRAGVLLWRPGATEERAQHDDDERRGVGRDQRAVGARRLFDRVRARLALVGRAVVARLQGRVPGPRSRLRGHDPAAGARHVPGDVRDHHARPHLGRDRGAHAVPRLRRVPRALGHVRLRPAGPLGVGAGGWLQKLAALACTNTNTPPATALTTWVGLTLARTGKATAVGAATGLVVGLVGITPAAGYISVPASIAVGALSALVSYTAIQIRATTRLDDSLDVFSCHGLAGVAGAMLTGVFASKAVNPAGADGWLAGNFHQMGVQLLAVVAAIAIAVIGTIIILTLVQAVFGTRAGVREQLAGLDLSEHGEEAYFGWDGSAAGPGISLGEGVIVNTVPAEPVGATATG